MGSDLRRLRPEHSLTRKMLPPCSIDGCDHAAGAIMDEAPTDADLVIPDITDSSPGTAPKPTPTTPVTPGTSAPMGDMHRESQWSCGRCDQLRRGLDATIPDHHPECPFRASGKDPAVG